MQPQSPQQPPPAKRPEPTSDPYSKFLGGPADVQQNTPKQAPFVPPTNDLSRDYQSYKPVQPANPNNSMPNQGSPVPQSRPYNQQAQNNTPTGTNSTNTTLPIQFSNQTQPAPNTARASAPTISQPVMPVAGPIGPVAESIDHESSHRSTVDEIKNLFYTIGLFILAPLFAIFMIVFVFQSYIVDGSSMEPTLQNGNRVFILKLPKSLASLQGKQYIPDRTDVIVFKKPTNDGSQLIKRVIGLPGERVVIKDGYVTVFNENYPEGFNPDSGTSYSGTLESIDTGGEVVDEIVADGKLFVLGDNRGPGGSLDSHSGLGQVPVENIVGKLWLRYFPLSEFQFF